MNLVVGVAPGEVLEDRKGMTLSPFIVWYTSVNVWADLWICGTKLSTSGRIPKDLWCKSVDFWNLLRFRGGLVFKAHRLLYHSTLALRVIKKIKKDLVVGVAAFSG